LHRAFNYARYFNSSQGYNTKKEKIKEINYFWNIKLKTLGGKRDSNKSEEYFEINF